MSSGLFFLFVNLHFLVFSNLYTIKLTDTNTTQNQTLNTIPKRHNSSVQEYLEDYYFSYKSFDVLDEYAVKICYAEINSLYFFYLVSIFPW